MVLGVIHADSVCNRCGKNAILTDNITQEIFCGKCGYVISGEMSDSGPEWRSFSKEGFSLNVDLQ